MRNLLALLGLILVTSSVVGYYLGWYKVTSNTGAEGHRTISIDLNTTKIGEDIAKGVGQIEKAMDKKQDDSKPDDTQTAKATSSTGTSDNSQNKQNTKTATTKNGKG